MSFLLKARKKGCPSVTSWTAPTIFRSQLYRTAVNIFMQKMSGALTN